jgi:heme/copper-type cytochrome/quinol oxidase subunit 1
MTGSWLTTADHKVIGRAYIVAALAFLLVGGAVGGLLRAGLDLSDASYLRLYDLHATGTAVLVLAPLWLGLATYLVPLQIGAVRLAFPRLQSFAFWSYVLGGILHLASYTGDGPRVAGLSFEHLTLTGSGDKAHTDLWIASLAVITIAAVLGAANLVATVLNLRTEGMTLGRIPMFSWATLVSGTGTVLAAPVFLAGLLLLFLDQHFGGREFFAQGTVGTQVVWQHMLWLYGRPDLYLLVVPGLGAASDIVSKAARRPLANTDAARMAIGAFAFLGFGAWAAGTKVAGAVVLPTYSGLTAAVVLPLGALVLLWLDTLRRAAGIKPDGGIAFVVAFILTVGAGGVAAVAAALKTVDGSAWSTGQVHLVAFAAPLLLAVGALHHWAPKLWGRPLSAAEAAAHALLLFGGAALTALGSYLAGWDGQAKATNVNDGFAKLSVAGGAVLLLGLVAVALAVLARTLQPGSAEDADGITLEWAAPSPPPPHNFDTLPEVRSDAPLADLRAAEAAS